MKRLPPAPTLNELLEKAPPGRASVIVEARDSLREAGGPWPHWDELRHRTPPTGFSREEWWLAIKFTRMGRLRKLPLLDAAGQPFQVAVDAVLEMLHQIDQRSAGLIALPEPLTNAETRDRYLVSSLMEEAITSSQLEGASTTRQVAAEMLRSGRAPTDHSERMIRNNYEAIQYIRRLRDQPLAVADVLELHRILTDGTLRNPDAAGRLQTPADERVTVVARDTGDILHIPPPAEQLPGRLAEMVRFANGETPRGQFLHPVIRAVMLHFWLAYDHPFEDGNGRTARALFYWCLIRNGYWLFEFVSISSILRKAFARYGRSYLHAESDENDATYFVRHQLEVMLQGIENLEAYLARKVEQIRAVEQRLRNAARWNHRQLALLGHALRHPGARYTIKSHQRSHDVAYATARADLLALAEGGLLKPARQGAKTLEFQVPADLEQRLAR